MSRYVPDEGPENSPILFVGEAPGETEEDQGRPFVGVSGDLLCNCLGRHGVRREEIRLANLCHHRPRGNKFELLLNSDELKEGLKELYTFIKEHRPNVIVPLGKWPLKFLTGKDRIGKWRGSILTCIIDENIKCIPTFHPAAVARDRSLYPIFDKDIQRAIADSAFPERNIPVRQFILDPRGLDAEEWVQNLCSVDTLACDIETVKRSTHILCVGFAPSKDVGVCFVPTHTEGRRAIERVLESSAKKVFQNGTFDLTQLRLNRYLVWDPYAKSLDREYYWDTLLAQHVMHPELPKSLEFMTSIYTREPYYKTTGRGAIPDDEKGWSINIDKSALYEYNARDCCVTYEIFEHQRKQILAKRSNGQWKYPNWVSTFDFQMSFLEVLHHIADSGMPIDIDRRDALSQALLAKWHNKQTLLNAALRCNANVRSPIIKTLLYDKEHLGLPVRRKRDGTITTDEDAIVSLIAFCKDKMESVKREDTKTAWHLKMEICKLILEIRGIRQLLSNYLVDTKKVQRMRYDGRIHSTYKFGPETGRLASSKYVDGTGFNAQTMPRDPIDVPEELLKINTEILITDLESEEDEEEEEEEAA